MVAALLLFLAVLVAANLVVTSAVARSVSYDKNQRMLQILFVWLAPVIGAFLAWHFLKEYKTERMTTNLSDGYGSDDGVIRNQDAYTESSSAESGGADGGGGD